MANVSKRISKKTLAIILCITALRQRVRVAPLFRWMLQVKLQFPENWPVILYQNVLLLSVQLCIKSAWDKPALFRPWKFSSKIIRFYEQMSLASQEPKVHTKLSNFWDDVGYLQYYIYIFIYKFIYLYSGLSQKYFSNNQVSYSRFIKLELALEILR